MNYEQGAFATGNKLLVGPHGEAMTKTMLTTNSLKLLDLAAPAPEGICMNDIAHGLSMHVRWAGQGRWLSVAQHSVMVLRCVEAQFEEGSAPMGLLRQALMHDAHEAYIGDLSGGLKYLLRESALKELILNLDRCIAQATPHLDFDEGPIAWDREIRQAEEHLVKEEYNCLFLGVEFRKEIEGPLCQQLAKGLFLVEAGRLGMTQRGAA